MCTGYFYKFSFLSSLTRKTNKLFENETPLEKSLNTNNKKKNVGMKF